MRIIFSRRELKGLKEEGFTMSEIRRIKRGMKVEFDEMRNEIRKEKED